MTIGREESNRILHGVTHRDPAVPLGVEEKEGLLEVRQLVLRETHLLRHPFKKQQQFTQEA